MWDKIIRQRIKQPFYMFVFVMLLFGLTFVCSQSLTLTMFTIFRFFVFVVDLFVFFSSWLLSYASSCACSFVLCFFCAVFKLVDLVCCHIYPWYISPAIYVFVNTHARKNVLSSCLKTNTMPCLRRVEIKS